RPPQRRPCPRPPLPRRLLHPRLPLPRLPPPPSRTRAGKPCSTTTLSCLCTQRPPQAAAALPLAQSLLPPLRTAPLHPMHLVALIFSC
ncbi:hypothetical protein H4R99_004139, partial [Coemansia sp. RSA 1722]